MNDMLLHSLLALVVVGLGTPASASRAPQPASACAVPLTLDGTWQSNNGGTHALRQIDSQVWWTGKSGDSGRSWTTVFQATRLGHTVEGRWTDLPPGKRRSSGSLTFRLIGSEYGATGFNRVSVTGRLRSSSWSFACNDTMTAPSTP